MIKLNWHWNALSKAVYNHEILNWTWKNNSDANVRHENALRLNEFNKLSASPPPLPPPRQHPRTSLGRGYLTFFSHSAVVQLLCFARGWKTQKKEKLFPRATNKLSFIYDDKGRVTSRRGLPPLSPSARASFPPPPPVPFAFAAGAAFKSAGKNHKANREDLNLN